jgi:nucleotide-binding universal stress UspA family protein
MKHMTNILHPTDFSECSDFAFRTACDLARASGGRVTVLHVVPPPIVVYGEGIVPPEPIGFLAAAEEAIGRRQCPDDAVRVDRRVVEGDPVTEILHAAAADGSDLIVLGTHGRTGLSRFLLGSIAERVVRMAPCAVLTVKGPAAAAAHEAALATGNMGNGHPRRGHIPVDELATLAR